ncbi:hypothetical protein BJ085DRAFT_16416, partial [Dimargaris cristalligena]
RFLHKIHKYKVNRVRGHFGPSNTIALLLSPFLLVPLVCNHITWGPFLGAFGLASLRVHFFMGISRN